MLGDTTFVPLVTHAYKRIKNNSSINSSSIKSLDYYLKEIESIAKNEFADYFINAYREVKRRKLGLHSFDDNNMTVPATTDTTTAAVMVAKEDESLWQDLQQLMYHSKCDFTILYRELGNVSLLFSTNTTVVTDNSDNRSGDVCNNDGMQLLEHQALSMLSIAFYDTKKV